MAEAAVLTVNPNMGGQEAAVAGSQAVIFTATDRKLIEERGGTIDKNQSFLEILKKRPLTPEVENEQTNVKPELNLKELEGRRKEHRRMLKHANVFNPHERVEIRNQLPDEFAEGEAPVTEKNVAPAPAIGETVAPPAMIEQKAEAIPETRQNGKETKADGETVYEAISEEQARLNTVKSRVKEYHLKRLFTDSQKEFNELSEKIKQESLAAVRPAGRKWLEAQLVKVTLGSAQYKLNLLNSLEELALDEQHKKTIKWLQELIKQLEQG
ncbi:MAG: hypothetical protein JW782_02395 [Candidatus Saganbacteria bacterium]|nr:hypothetical protein [Candidatus Saganbacteria bacterium]